MTNNTDQEKVKKFLDAFKDLDPFEQGFYGYRYEIACIYPNGSFEAAEWRRGELSASLGDEWDDGNIERE